MRGRGHNWVECVCVREGEIVKESESESERSIANGVKKMASCVVSARLYASCHFALSLSLSHLQKHTRTCASVRREAMEHSFKYTRTQAHSHTHWPARKFTHRALARFTTTCSVVQSCLMWKLFYDSFSYKTWFHDFSFTVEVFTVFYFSTKLTYYKRILYSVLQTLWLCLLLSRSESNWTVLLKCYFKPKILQRVSCEVNLNLKNLLLPFSSDIWW